MWNCRRIIWKRHERSFAVLLKWMCSPHEIWKMAFYSLYQHKWNSIRVWGEIMQCQRESFKLWKLGKLKISLFFSPRESVQATKKTSNMSFFHFPQFWVIPTATVLGLLLEPELIPSWTDDHWKRTGKVHPPNFTRWKFSLQQNHSWLPLIAPK